MDRFLYACGSTTGPRLAIQGGDHIVYALSQACVLIGRSPLCDIRLDHPDVSPRHAYLQMIEGRLACFDLGTPHGFRCGNANGVRFTWMDHDVGIGIGPFVIRRVDHIHSAQAYPPPDPQQISYTREIVFLESFDETGSQYLRHITHAITLIGRDSLCRVRLPDVSISWFHCSLVCTPHGVWVVDLMSRGGLIVNGIPTRYTPLHDGDELVLGDFRCFIRYPNRPRGSCEVATNTNPLERIHDTIADAPFYGPSVPYASLTKELLPVAEVLNPMDSDLFSLLGPYKTDTPYPPIMMLVERFGQMQQQMLEQFHETMMLMMVNVGKAHHAEIHHVREEVERLRDLSQELLALKEHLSRPPSSHGPEHAGMHGSDSGARSVRSDTGLLPSAHVPLSAPIKQDTPEIRSSRLPVAESPEDPLVQVTRRIAQIRDEQRTHWQKILDLIRLR